METTQQDLEWNGDAYHRLSDFQYDAAMELTDLLCLRGDERILDAGCGSGRITREILKRVPHGAIVGVDISGSMLQTARREVVAQPGQSIDFLQRDLQNFTELSELDGLFSNMAIHFVHDHALLFKNFAKMLKPGGWIALQFGSSEQNNPVLTEVFDTLNAPPFGDYLKAKAFHFVGSDRATTREQLENAGFKDIETLLLPLAIRGASRDKMLTFFEETVVQDCEKRLPTEALRRDLRAKIMRSMQNAFDHPINQLRVRARLAARH